MRLFNYPSIFISNRIGKTIRLNLHELRNTQPPTPPYTDNYTATGITNNTVIRAISREMEIIYIWILDQVDQKISQLFWTLGQENVWDYHTKHHPPYQHQ